MENEDRNRMLITVLPAAFFILLIFNVFTVTDFPIRELAFTTMEWTQYLALILIGRALRKQTITDKSMAPFYISFALFAGVYILIHLIHGNIYDNSALTEVLLFLAFIFAMVHVKWQSKSLVLFAYISTFLILLLFIGWMVTGHPMANFYGWTRNPNIAGVFFSCLIFFPIAVFSKVRKWVKVLLAAGIVLACIIIYTSSARAVLLLLITAVGARIVLLFSRKIFAYLFHVVFIFNMLFLFVYVLLAASPLFVRLNDWSVDTFGKNLFSGRQNIWGEAIAYGKEAFFFGHKIGIVPKDFIEGTHYVHTHNQYVQIFLESGLVGFACFTLFLFGIWKIYQKGLDDAIVRWSACFFLGILVYQNVEISLFFNIQAIGLLQWFIIALGMSGVLYQQRKSVEQTEQPVSTDVPPFRSRMQRRKS